jgi:hypothetical protein
MGTPRVSRDDRESERQQAVQQVPHLTKLPNQHVLSPVVVVIVWPNSKIMYKPRNEKKDSHDEGPDFDAEPSA